MYKVGNKYNFIVWLTKKYVDDFSVELKHSFLPICLNQRTMSESNRSIA